MWFGKLACELYEGAPTLSIAMAEHAEFFAVYSEAASDGHFSDREMLEMLPKAEDVRRSADNLVQKIHRRLAKALSKGGDE